jgi:hypothetical protein
MRRLAASGERTTMDQRTRTDREDPVTVVLDQDRPVRLDWDGSRYYPDEQPCPLDGAAAEPAAPEVTVWRIHASTPQGSSHLFYVRTDPNARWTLTRLDPDEGQGRSRSGR